MHLFLYIIVPWLLLFFYWSLVRTTHHHARVCVFVRVRVYVCVCMCACVLHTRKFRAWNRFLENIINQFRCEIWILAIPTLDAHSPDLDELAPRENLAPRELHLAPRELHLAPRELHLAPRELHLAPRESWINGTWLRRYRLSSDGLNSHARRSRPNFVGAHTLHTCIGLLSIHPVDIE